MAGSQNYFIDTNQITFGESLPTNTSATTILTSQTLFSCFQTGVLQHLLNEGYANDRYNALASKLQSNDWSSKSVEIMKNLIQVVQYEALQAVNNYNTCLTATNPSLTEYKLCNLQDYITNPYSITSDGAANIISQCYPVLTAGGVNDSGPHYLNSCGVGHFDECP